MRVPWNEDMRVKFPATIQFMRLGYEYQSLKDAEIHTETRIFLNRFVPSIQRINSGKVLTEEQILAEVEEIHNIIKNNDMGKEFLARLLDQTADIKLIDFTHPESNDFAIVDEEGHAHFYARLEFCRLERVGSGVALETRFGVNDFELRLDGHFSVEKART